jgi:hypothetical protein
VKHAAFEAYQTLDRPGASGRGAWKTTSFKRKCSKADHVNCVVHRLNLFPLIHLNFFHMIFNLVTVTPLIERFESEYGTLVTLALFTGRKQCTFQGLDT